MVRVIVHINMLRRIDVKIKPALHAAERRDRDPQLRFVEPGHPQHRRRRHTIFDIHPSRNARRAIPDHAVGTNKVERVPPVRLKPDAVGVKVAGRIVCIPVNPDSVVTDIQFDPLFENQRAARSDLPDKLRKSLFDRFVRPVNVEMVGIDRRHDRDVRIELQKRPIELVGLDDQSFPRAEHQVTTEILGNPAEKSAAAAPGLAIEPRGHRTGRRLAVRSGDGHQVFPLGHHAEHPRTLDDLESSIPEKSELQTIGRDRRRINHQRIGLVPKRLRNRIRLVLISNGRSFALQCPGQFRRGAVVSGHLFPLVQEITCQGAHPDPSDS